MRVLKAIGGHPAVLGGLFARPYAVANYFNHTETRTRLTGVSVAR